MDKDLFMADARSYAELLADTENTWDLEESLEELVFESTDIFDEAFNKRLIIPGDIIMANNGRSNRPNSIDILSPHRIFVVDTVEEDNGNHLYKGYLISSQQHKANYYNKNFPKNIYISNFGDALERGPKLDKPGFINLSDKYIVDESRLSTDSSLWKGHVSSAFWQFIKRLEEKIKNNEDVSQEYWIESTKKENRD